MNKQSLTLVKNKPKPSFTPVQNGLLQRKCACGSVAGLTGKCSECEQKKLTLQRRARDRTNTDEVPPIVHEVLQSSGQPLDRDTRAFMESRFGHDFSQVRVHRDRKATESAKAVNALAYTVGSNIVFDSGQYTPETATGNKLLAHELTHTIQQQQSSPAIQSSLTIAQNNSQQEEEADNVANSVMQGQPTKILQLQTSQLVRQTAMDEGVDQNALGDVNLSNRVEGPAPQTNDLSSDDSSTTKCNVNNFWMKFEDWNISWPGLFSKSTTIRLPVRFRVDLSPGSKKSDCLIGQNIKGYTQMDKQTPDDFPSWTADGETGHRFWWDGSNWYGGKGSWDWFGNDGADFYDEPGFDSVSLDFYPLYWGGNAGKTGFFKFETYIADKATQRTVNSILWSMLIDYKTPKEGEHKRG